MAEKFLPVSKPTITKKEISEVVDSMKSGWITTGPKVKKFEENFKKFVKAKNAVALNSGTAALHLAYQIAGLKKGDEVITTSMTFVATVNMLLVLGLKPIFVDIEDKTLNINVDLIEKKITKKTKAIVPVHFAGRPVRMDVIQKLAKKYKLKVIEDAAHAVGGKYKGKMIGSMSDVTCFSFHPMKNITTGEGGMLTTENSRFAREARALRFHGIDKEAWARYSKKGVPFYDVTSCGYKYNMLDIQAAIGLHQLDRLNEFNKKRTYLASLYDKELSKIEELIIPPFKCPHGVNSWHIYVVAVKKEKLKIDRNTFIMELKKHNVGCGVHYVAVHMQPYYKKTLGYKKGTLPICEYYSERIMSLPLYPLMTKADVLKVAKAIKQVIKKNKK
jgi:dTDP-4-amino-4,6-dideoxygalactose transaminase